VISRYFETIGANTILFISCKESKAKLNFYCTYPLHITSSSNIFRFLDSA